MAQIAQRSAGLPAAGLPPAGAAPGELEKVRALVNSRDLEQGTDELATAAGLESWLERHGLAPPAGAGLLTRADLDRAVALREALRSVLRPHARAPASAARTGDEASPGGTGGQAGAGGTGGQARVSGTRGPASPG